MPKARIKFSRDERSMRGFMSKNRPSTDALGALDKWRHAAPGRKYREVIDSDTDDTIDADLEWDAGDGQAGGDLDAACQSFGVARKEVAP